MSVTVLASATQQILALVHSLGLDVGARLPSERRLAIRLGWSRNTVREALAGLAAQGLVEIRACSGTYLCAAAVQASHPDDPTPLCNAAEALFLLAPALAAATCPQCGNAELAHLEASTMQMGQALVDNNLLDVWRGLAAFYRELAALGGNPLVLGFIDTLGAAPAPASTATVPLGAALQPFFSAHIELLHAIRSRDAEGSAAQSTNSINAFLRFLVTWQAGTAPKPMARQGR